MIALGCDHGGYALMQEVKKYLDSKNMEYKDFGTYSEDSCDYPVFAKRVAESITAGESEKGILICSTGIGISIAANRYPGIRAGLCHNEMTARLTREHNNANVLAMGAKVLTTDEALKVVETFFNTDFSEGERHIRRVNLIERD